MKRGLRLLALVLAAAVLLGGCGSSLLRELLNGQQAQEGYTAFGDMQYTRPDMEAHDALLEEACNLGQTGRDLEAVMEAVYAYYDCCDSIYTNYSLADLYYCMDMSDTYWQEETGFCAEAAAQADGGLEALYYALARSPILEQLEGEAYFGPGFFDGYRGENPWADPQVEALIDRELALEEQYYALWSAALQEPLYTSRFYRDHAPGLEQVFLELIRVRQDLAAAFGYDSYPEFAYDCYHYRDYGPAQAEEYLVRVAKTLGPVYSGWTGSGWGGYCGEEDLLAYAGSAARAMGGQAQAAFAHLETYGLCHLAPGENKYDGAFEVYLTAYGQPFIFLNPMERDYDKLSFVHEFGHFLGDFAVGGSYAGTDVLEVQSQGMEYLSLLYADGGRDLVEMKLEDSLNLYVEQSAYALFELRVYGLTGQDLTAENVRRIFGEVCGEFCLDPEIFAPQDYVAVNHFFVEPMYVMSYVLSNDLAMQLYQRELAEAGAGLAVYNELIYSQESYILAFAEEYGLADPFSQARLEAARDLFLGLGE